MIDREAQARVMATYADPEPGTRAWEGRELDVHVFTKWAVLSQRADGAGDSPDVSALLASAEANIATISNHAKLAGLLTDAEVAVLIGDDEVAAKTLIVQLRGGAPTTVFTRRPDGTVQTQVYGPDRPVTAPEPRDPRLS